MDRLGFSEVLWCAYGGHLGRARGGKAEVFVLSPSAGREPPFYLIKGRQRGNKADWPAPFPVSGQLAALVTPSMHHR